MLSWIADNIWTIIICAVLIGIVSAIIAGMVKKKKKGASVSCGCGSCPMSAACHSSKNGAQDTE